MKCHTCQQELVPNRDIPNVKRWECSLLHVHDVYFDSDGQITQYEIFWDDIDKDARYKLTSRQNKTIMYHRPFIQPENRPMEHIGAKGFVGYDTPRRWSTVMEFPNFLPLTIKDDIIQIDNLIHRLLKLRAFS